MKNHIAFKFLAILLAAFFLLSAGICAAGIIAIAAMDLAPGQTVQERYMQDLEDRYYHPAQIIAQRYATKTLGKGTTQLVGSWYTSWAAYEGYQLTDETGTILESSGAKGDCVEISYNLPSVSYIQVIESNLDAAAVQSARDSKAQEETTYQDLPEEDVSTENAAAEQEEPTEANTVPYTEQPESPAVDAVDAYYKAQYADEDDIFVGQYPLPQGGTRFFSYRCAESPAYQVTLYISADSNEMLWDFMELIYANRTLLTVGLGVSLLAFALLAAYLCCAAGRKPGSDEVHAGGLNRTPLDLYAIIVGAGIWCVAALLVPHMDSLLSMERSLILAILGYSGYGCSLMVVGFCFAFAAQVKTPGAYWWNNSICGRCWHLLVRFLKWCWRVVPAVLKWVWNLFLRILRAGEKVVIWCWELVLGLLRAVGRWVRRIYGMLPLIWQWIIAIPLLFLLLLVNIGSAGTLGILLRLGVVGLVTVYFAFSFGTLLSGAQKMCSGDLESKVDDRLLVGCFREFADSLNSLSDVAVVAAREQSKSERMRSELITNVSHDIKTPLTSIINYVDLLQMPHTPEQEAEWLAVLNRQSGRLKKLIEDLIEMSKAASGSLPVDIVELDAGEAVNQALGEFADKLAAAELTPVFHAPEAPEFMLADGRLAWRAMSNLLSNAVKYALPGTRFYIDISRVEENVLISMKNISREPLNVSAEDLMERFVRGDTSRNTEGSGLGLNIAKNLMELQKGKLQLLVDGDLFKATLIFPAAEDKRS